MWSFRRLFEYSLEVKDCNVEAVFLRSFWPETEVLAETAFEQRSLCSISPETMVLKPKVSTVACVVSVALALVNNTETRG